MTNTLMESVATAAPITSVAQFFARIAFAGGLLGLLLLGALHFLRPDLDPSWHVLSEYALGPHGWIMTVCFLSFAVACAALLVVLFPQVTSVGGRIGLAFMVAAAIGMVMGAVFAMDPITATAENATFSGRMHGVAAIIGNPGFIIGSLVLSYVLRANPIWTPVSGPLILLAHVTWISFALMIGFIIVALLQQQAMVGPGVIGLANRALLGAYGAWLMVAAWPVARASGVD